MSIKAKIMKSDGWVNLLTKLGSKGDRVTTTTFHAQPRLNQRELEAQYEFSGFAKSIVDVPAGDMLREWISIPNDEGDNIQSYMRKLRLKSEMLKLVRWSRLHGGAIMVMGINDGRDLSEPVNEEFIRSIDFLKVYDRWQVCWTTNDLEDDPTSKNYGLPKTFMVSPLTGALTPFTVHRSRCLVMYGEDLPENAFIANNYWGGSVLQHCIDALRNIGVGFNGSANIITDFIQSVMQIENLQEMIATDKEDLIVKRLSLLDKSRSIINTILIDKNETYEKKASSVGGLYQLVELFMYELSAVTRIPVSKLFGRSAAGLNATGEGDRNDYYDFIKSEQEEKLQEPLNYVACLIARTKAARVSVDPREVEVVLNPLWQLSDEKEALWKKTVAETDAIYLQNAVVSPEEVAVSRFGGETYSSETAIDKSLRNIEVED